jgi:hypothetical protein
MKQGSRAGTTNTLRHQDNDENMKETLTIVKLAAIPRLQALI